MKLSALLLCMLLFVPLGCSHNKEPLFIEEPVLNELEELPMPMEAPLPQVTSEIIVEIKGEVLYPGVYTMKEGDRLIDLFRKAGEGTSTAFLKEVNLAMKIADGQSFYIPKEGEATSIISGADAVSDQDGGRIDLNKATKEELMSVTGIGPSTAENILAYRQEKGSFKSVDELVQVNRIGDKTLAKIRDYFIVP